MNVHPQPLYLEARLLWLNTPVDGACSILAGNRVADQIEYNPVSSIAKLQKMEKNQIMSIELTTKNDAKAVFALLSKCKDNLIEQGIFQWDEKYPNLDYVESDIARGSLVKLIRDDQMVGIVSFDDFQEPEYRNVNWHINSKPIAVIHRLAVDPLFQGNGFARTLMNFAELSISEAGFQAIRLDAYSGNEMLLGFYKKLGYKKVGEINFPRMELPFICMEKSTKT